MPLFSSQNLRGVFHCYFEMLHYKWVVMSSLHHFHSSPPCSQYAPIFFQIVLRFVFSSLVNNFYWRSLLFTGQAPRFEKNTYFTRQKVVCVYGTPSLVISWHHQASSWRQKMEASSETEGIIFAIIFYFWFFARKHEKLLLDMWWWFSTSETVLRNAASCGKYCYV